MAFCGFRVYQEGGTKSDERGAFEGWSHRFDEWISVYSPKIQPLYSKTMKGLHEEEIDDNFDNLL